MPSLFTSHEQFQKGGEVTCMEVRDWAVLGSPNVDRKLLLVLLLNVADSWKS